MLEHRLQGDVARRHLLPRPFHELRLEVTSCPTPRQRIGQASYPGGWAGRSLDHRPWQDPFSGSFTVLNRVAAQPRDDGGAAQPRTRIAVFGLLDGLMISLGGIPPIVVSLSGSSSRRDGVAVQSRSSNCIVVGAIMLRATAICTACCAARRTCRTCSQRWSAGFCRVECRSVIALVDVEPAPLPHDEGLAPVAGCQHVFVVEKDLRFPGGASCEDLGRPCPAGSRSDCRFRIRCHRSTPRRPVRGERPAFPSRSDVLHWP